MANELIARKSILLVDDDEMHLQITELALKDNYDVYMEKSGKEALDFLTKGETVPDLILLDILMPDMDGWLVFDKIHNIASLKFIPIIFYTSLDEESAKEKAYDIGLLDYIIKPCEKTDLLSRIGTALQKTGLEKWHYELYNESKKD
ncbi:MAG: response regulator [Spirochaetes bacterium]|nr:response regulator [Spirochaetota bacterium]